MGRLSDAQAFGAFTEEDGKEALVAQAKAAIDRALQLAPDNPEVIGSYGTYFYYAYRDYARAVEQYQRLARLQPNSPANFHSLALIQRRQGHWAESLVNGRRAVELDPANVGYQRSLEATLVAGRRWDEAIATQRRIVALLPDKLDEAYAARRAGVSGHGFHAGGRRVFRGHDSGRARLSPGDNSAHLLGRGDRELCRGHPPRSPAAVF